MFGCDLSQGGMGENPLISSFSMSRRFNFRRISRARKIRVFLWVSGGQSRPLHLCKSFNTSYLIGLLSGR